MIELKRIARWARLYEDQQSVEPRRPVDVPETGITAKQRKAVLERDDFQGQLPVWVEDRTVRGYCSDPPSCPESQLHVHHVEPRSWLSYHNHTERNLREEINDPRNILTVASCIHVGVCRQRRIDDHEKYVEGKYPVIHEDTELATRTYQGYRTLEGVKISTFTECEERRHEAITNGKPYWNTEYDQVAREIAEDRTHKAAWVFPKLSR